ncbi:ABC transporter ATP-binding protein [Priestia flexa]|uniref:ABC transporter ATP-binding protein n=1 Tax=Priestia flexa TaxID=86664 RepID=UPI0013D000AD|nr:ABC transporter ATP-binding protein [Priestia flexa]
MSGLQITNVHHVYVTMKSATTALENINLSIKEGEFISFLGPSGCGKTTLLSILAGLIKPTSGEVNIKNKLVQEPTAEVGYMLQQDYLFPWKTIKDNILLGLTIQRNLTKEHEQRALMLLEGMGLKSVSDFFPHQLSGGMRQRVALVRTLATNPSILLLDEPFSALDFQTKLKLEELVSKTLMTYEKTAVLVTHDIGEAIAMSNRIVLFSANPGRIARIFTVPSILQTLSPFEARQHSVYNDLFMEIWKELDHLESASQS